MELKSPLNDILVNELRYAKKKHEVFPDDVSECACVIGEEYGEVCKAINEYNDIVNNAGFEFGVPDCRRDEALLQIALELSHTAVTAMRALDLAIYLIGESNFKDMYENFCVTREEEWQGSESDSQQE